MRVSVLTLGCKVNQAESACIEGNLIEHGHSIVSLSEHPDYCIINTCSVTAKSDYQSRQLIRRAVRSGAKVMVTGCYSQLRPDEIRKIESCIDIIPNSDKLHIINILSNNKKSSASCFSGRCRPYLKIQDGCSFACTYCIVPKARGKSRSLGVGEILERAYQLESLGYNEIVLTGIHLGSYGRDIIPQVKLADIIATLLRKTTIHRIRLSSLELNEIDGQMIDLLSEDRICKHLHVPLQSGDDAILKRMNRMYSTEDYVRVIESLLASVPGIALGTDVIVGFPGEGEKEFLNTENLLATLPFSYFHIFPFSPRPDTPASKMENRVPDTVKKERCRRLSALNISKKFQHMSSQINRVVDVIVEERLDDQTVIGTSGNYLKIKFSSNRCPRKSLVYVRAAGIDGDLINGIPIEKL